MNSELAKIDVFLKTSGYAYKSYAELSKDVNGHSLVTDSTTEAFDFDEISKSFFSSNACVCSADALLLKDNLYLIEFKTVAKTKPKWKYEEIKKNLCMKISESLIVLDKEIIQPNSVDETRFEKYFVITIDSAKLPIDAMSCAMVGLSAPATTPAPVFTFSQKSLSESFDKYRLPDKNGNHIFYEDVIILNDKNFSAMVKSFT